RSAATSFAEMSAIVSLSRLVVVLSRFGRGVILGFLGRGLLLREARFTVPLGGGRLRASLGLLLLVRRFLFGRTLRCGGGRGGGLFLLCPGRAVPSRRVSRPSA